MRQPGGHLLHHARRTVVICRTGDQATGTGDAVLVLTPVEGDKRGKHLTIGRFGDGGHRRDGVAAGGGVRIRSKHCRDRVRGKLRHADALVERGKPRVKEIVAETVIASAKGRNSRDQNQSGNAMRVADGHLLRDHPAD